MAFAGDELGRGSNVRTVEGFVADAGLAVLACWLFGRGKHHSDLHAGKEGSRRIRCCASPQDGE